MVAFSGATDADECIAWSAADRQNKYVQALSAVYPRLDGSTRLCILLSSGTGRQPSGPSPPATSHVLEKFWNGDHFRRPTLKTGSISPANTPATPSSVTWKEL